MGTQNLPTIICSIYLVSLIFGLVTAYKESSTSSPAQLLSCFRVCWHCFVVEYEHFSAPSIKSCMPMSRAFFLFPCRGSLPKSLFCNAACFRASGLDFTVKFCKEKWTTITINNHLLPNHYFTTARCRRISNLCAQYKSFRKRGEIKNPGG